jgi:hypothetical protein
MKTIEQDFLQAKALLRDAIFKENADPQKRETLAILKLIKAREENIDFELQLAEKICGDNQFYPYRTSYYITKFFSDLGYKFEHDGSTRRLWIKDVLLTLDTKQISSLIKYGLFKKADYKNEKLRTDFSKALSSDDFLELAIKDFRQFVDDSIRANEVVDIAEVLNLNVNIDLLFQAKTYTKDEELNALVAEAKDRYLRPGDQHIALEKIWDAFERLKTYYEKDKKTSSSILINEMSIDLEVPELVAEFEALTKIGNKYRIRHHETDKKNISDPTQVKYLFFRMLSLIDLSIEIINKNESVDKLFCLRHS